MDTNNEVSLFDLQVDHESTVYLTQTAKWAKFLSILGFIFTGFFLIAGVGMLAMSMTESGFRSLGSYGIGGGAYLFMALTYFFPCLFTGNFARQMRTALQNNDQARLNSSLRNLRSAFRYMGIMSIVGIALLVIGIVIGLSGALGRL